MLCEDLWCSVMRCDTSWYSVMPCETSVMSRDVLWQGSRPHTFHAAIDYATADKIIIGLLLVCVCCCAVVVLLFLNCTSYKSKTLQRASSWASTQCWCRSVNDNKITCRYQKQFGNNYFVRFTRYLPCYRSHGLDQPEVSRKSYNCDRRHTRNWERSCQRVR